MTEIDVSQLKVCRVLGHAWDSFDPVGMERPPWGWRLSVRCTRCGRVRHDVIDRFGELSYRTYEPRTLPQIEGKTGERPTMAEYRLLARKELT